jgi:hypothetical protein
MDMLSTKKLAARLGISREAARKIMVKTKGVITLPTINGSGTNATRRMPEAVYQSLLVRHSKPTKKGTK